MFLQTQLPPQVSIALWGILHFSTSHIFSHRRSLSRRKEAKVKKTTVPEENREPSGKMKKKTKTRSASRSKKHKRRGRGGNNLREKMATFCTFHFVCFFQSDSPLIETYSCLLSDRSASSSSSEEWQGKGKGAPRAHPLVIFSDKTVDDTRGRTPPKLFGVKTAFWKTPGHEPAAVPAFSHVETLPFPRLCFRWPELTARTQRDLCLTLTHAWHAFLFSPASQIHAFLERLHLQTLKRRTSPSVNPSRPTGEDPPRLWRKSQGEPFEFTFQTTPVKAP